MLLVAILAVATILIARDRAAVLAAVTTAQGNLALGLEREILRNVDIYDLSLRAAASGLRFLDGTSDPAVQNAILFDGSTAARHFRPIVIADAAGTVVRDGGADAPRIASLVGRPFFEAHRTQDELGLLVMLNTRSLIDGRPYLSLSRRVRAADGTFGGVVAGGLDLAYLHEIFSRFTLPAGSAIALVDDAGRQVAGFPPGGNHGDHRGSDRVTTLRRLGALPFSLTVSAPGAAVFADWTLRAWAAGLGLLGFVVSCCVLLAMLVRELARRRQAERAAVAAGAAARAGEARLATYVDHLADGLLAIRRAPDGRFTCERINAAAAAMLGIEPQAAIGRTAREVWSGPAGAFTEGKWRDCFVANDTLRYEQVLEVAGARRVLRFVLAPVTAPETAPVTAPVTGSEPGSGPPVALLLASLRDVTASVDLEAKLRQSQRMEAVGQLTAGVAHDFNNMLQAQLGALELLVDEVADQPHALELANLALGTGQHGARLTHSLLSFSRQQHLAPQPVPVATMLEGLGRMLARTFGPLVTIRLRVPDGVPPPFADRAQLEAALLNLALNARDAITDTGSPDTGSAECGVITIEGRGWRPEDGEDLWPEGAPPPVLLAVSDTGQGMAPDVLAKACEPFFSTKGVGRGSGLGLSMVQGFVQQSGGAMRLRSEPGRGTRVELWLPATRAAALAPCNAPAGDVSGTGRVLLVDDMPDVLAITAELLEASGFAVVQAAHGAEALATLESEPPFDILVTDYSMPGMDGAALVRAARMLFPALPVLVVTGQADLDRLRDLPPDVEVLRKPLGGRVLARHLVALLERLEPAQPARCAHTAAAMAR